jgi:hypothetical protein
MVLVLNGFQIGPAERSATSEEGSSMTATTVRDTPKTTASDAVAAYATVAEATVSMGSKTYSGTVSAGGGTRPPSTIAQ